MDSAKHFSTTYGNAHSPADFRPQRELYRLFHGAQAESAPAREKAPLYRHFSIHDSSFCAREVGVDERPGARASGFSRNTTPQIADLTTPLAPEPQPAVSEYKHAYLPRKVR